MPFPLPVHERESVQQEKIPFPIPFRSVPSRENVPVWESRSCLIETEFRENFSPQTGESFWKPESESWNEESEMMSYSETWAICQRLARQKSWYLSPTGFNRHDCQAVMLWGAQKWNLFVLNVSEGYVQSTISHGFHIASNLLRTILNSTLIFFYS